MRNIRVFLARSLGAVFVTAIFATPVLTRQAAAAIAGGGGGPLHPRQSVGAQFVRGNANNDRYLDTSDAVFLTRYLFQGGPAPVCLDAADINDDGRIDVSDPQYLLNFLYRGGPRPPAPFPLRGEDPTPDDLRCRPTLSVSFLPVPVSQNVVAGTENFEAAQIALDASRSSEDIAVTRLIVRVQFTGGSAPAYHNLHLFNGADRLTPLETLMTCSESVCEHFFPLTAAVPVAKGTIKIIRVVGDVSPSSTSGTFTVFLDPNDIAAGASGNLFLLPLVRTEGNPMTIVASGRLAISALTTQHPAGLLPANTSGLEVGVFRLTAAREPIRIEKIYLSADSTRPVDPQAGRQASAFNQVRAIHLYDGATRLTPPAGVQPTSTDRLDRATVLIDLSANPVVVPLVSVKDILVKVDTHPVTRYPRASTGDPGQGFRLSINTTTDILAKGAQSGITLGATTAIELSGVTLSDWAVMGSVPTVTVHGDLPAAERIGGSATLPKLVAGSQKEIYRFKVGADSAGDVYVFGVSIATDMQKATVTNPFIVLADTGQQLAATTTAPFDSVRTTSRLYRSWSFIFTSDGLAPTNTTYSPRLIHSGVSKLFVMKGDVSCWTDNGCGATNPSGSLGVSFLGDAAFPTTYPDGANRLYVQASSNRNHFIWSDASIMGPLGVASGTATTSEQWYNGYRVRSAVSPLGRLQPTTTDVTFNP